MKNAISALSHGLLALLFAGSLLGWFAFPSWVGWLWVGIAAVDAAFIFVWVGIWAAGK